MTFNCFFLNKPVDHCHKTCTHHLSLFYQEGEHKIGTYKDYYTDVFLMPIHKYTSWIQHRVKSDSVKMSKMCPLPFRKRTFSTEWIIIQVWIKRWKREWWIFSNSWQSEYTACFLEMNCVGVWYWQLGEAEFLLRLLLAVTSCLLPVLRIVACLLKSSVLWTNSESAPFGMPSQFLYIFRYNVIG